ncbi:MAG: GntR family transcriptional regulator [Dorea sp.]|jgi:DNA-binding transcriptional regulator YhcF (GntR family)|nr:GntR family transcriptional regulator [Dorea sp.]
MDMGTSELRYLELKNKICYQIYNGVYEDGERIPSERQLAADYDVSRITVRKALEILEEEDLIRREVGSGTHVTYRNWGNDTALDVAALVAPSKNPFFAEFITKFQKTAWEHDTLLLYVEVPEKTGLEDCLYQLYSKNIRNAVVWPDDKQVDAKKLLRLRSIGMNLVFFDTDDAFPYADCVYLDNEDAVRTLVGRQPKKYGRHLFIGWDNLAISNVKKREEAFQRFCPEGEVIRVPWRRDRNVGETDIKRIEEKIRSMGEGLIVCNNGELGQRTAELLRETGMSKTAALAVVDDFEGAEGYPVSVYRQDLAKDAECIYRQLEEQAAKGRNWKAKRKAIKGIYADYGEGEE